MASFTDALGREWRLTLTVADLKTLREWEFDPAKLATAFDGLGEFLIGDPEKLVRVVHLLARVPADVDADSFARGFDGPTLERAGNAVIEAVIGFFPRSRIAQAMTGRVREALARMDEGLIGYLASNDSAGNSPGSPASTPAP